MNLKSLKLLLTVWLAWSGPQARFAITGWDTCPAWLTLKVLLNSTQKVKCLKEVGYLTKSVGCTKSTLVVHLKSILLSDLFGIAWGGEQDYFSQLKMQYGRRFDILRVQSGGNFIKAKSWAWSHIMLCAELLRSFFRHKSSAQSKTA